MIRAKVLRRKHPKRLLKPDLKANLCRLLCSNDLRVQVFCSGKATYRLHVYRRNPRDGCYFHQQNNGRIKANEDLDFFCGCSEKSVFNGSKKSCFKIFLNLYEEEFTVPFTSFRFY